MNSQVENQDRGFVRLPEVKRFTGKSRSGIYKDIKAGIFPAPVKIGPRAVGWSRKNLAEWEAAQISAR